MTLLARQPRKAAPFHSIPAVLENMKEGKWRRHAMEGEGLPYARFVSLSSCEHSLSHPMSHPPWLSLMLCLVLLRRSAMVARPPALEAVLN